MASCRQTIIHSILYDIYLHSHTQVQILRWRPQDCSPVKNISMFQPLSSCRQTIIHSILYDIYLHSHTKVQIIRWRPQDCSPIKNISMFQPLSLSNDDPFNLQIVGFVSLRNQLHSTMFRGAGSKGNQLAFLSLCLHWIAIRTLPLFTLTPPADMFILNHHQNFTLIRPYPTYRYVYIGLPSEFHPYSPLSVLTDMFTLNCHQNLA